METDKNDLNEMKLKSLTKFTYFYGYHTNRYGNWEVKFIKVHLLSNEIPSYYYMFLYLLSAGASAVCASFGFKIAPQSLEGSLAAPLPSVTVPFIMSM